MRYKCSNPRCLSSKPARKMSQVFRSRSDPKPIGLVCSGGCARVVIAADAKASARAASVPVAPTAALTLTPRRKPMAPLLALVLAVASVIALLAVELR